MKKSILFLIPFLFLLISCDKDEDRPDKDSPEALVEFVPPGYYILDTLRADLNNDKRSDLLMVLENEPENEEEDHRLLLILTGQKNNTYKLEKQNQHAVYCRSCGGELGDPFLGILLTGTGGFTIEHFGGDDLRWARTITFDYLENDWFLVEDALVSSPKDKLDDIDAKILTPKDFGEVRFEEFDIYQ